MHRGPFLLIAAIRCTCSTAAATTTIRSRSAAPRAKTPCISSGFSPISRCWPTASPASGTLESGHPGIFVDDDGQTYLFFQGNDDHGRTWYISWVKLGWKDGRPYVQ